MGILEKGRGIESKTDAKELVEESILEGEKSNRIDTWKLRIGEKEYEIMGEGMTMMRRRGLGEGTRTGKEVTGGLGLGVKIACFFSYILFSFSCSPVLVSAFSSCNFYHYNNSAPNFFFDSH